MEAIRSLITAMFIIVLFSCSYATIRSSVGIKELYSAPSSQSKLVYQIPMEVKLLDVSEDTNWYKVSIKFNIGPMEFRYSGWTNIPIGTILAERAEKNKLAALISK
ncbi:hypothetical protein HZC34_07225 [Candidatus Saganbacteria bacterium]|nr:hypothetical protein [Candidatus Saganbacteria bacterium]